MSTDTKYTLLLADEEAALREDDNPSIVRNPAAQYEIRKTYGMKRILAILAVLAFFVCFLATSRPYTSKGEPPIVNIANDSRLESYQSPSGPATECPDWPEEKDGSRRSSVLFEFPTTFDLLFVLSRGEVAGHLSIVKSDKYNPSGTIEVNVTAQYHDRASLERTKVCRVGQESKNEHGVLIWALPKQTAAVTFNVTVVIPKSVREYNDISTDLPYFSHQVGDFFDLWSPTAFKTIRFKSQNAPIDYGSLVGEAAYIQTNDAEVRGFFAGPGSVNVFTTNSAIHSTSMMFGEARGWETQVHLRTSNAPIEAFLSVTSDYIEPKLTATVQTTNGALNISTSRYPMGTNSSFFLDASTSNAPSIIAIHPDYEGTFDLETSLASSRVYVDNKVKDPSGNGRRRTVEDNNTGSHAQGAIFWSYDGEPSEEGRSRGSISVRNSKSPIKMYC